MAKDRSTHKRVFDTGRETVANDSTFRTRVGIVIHPHEVIDFVKQAGTEVRTGISRSTPVASLTRRKFVYGVSVRSRNVRWNMSAVLLRDTSASNHIWRTAAVNSRALTTCFSKAAVCSASFGGRTVLRTPSYHCDWSIVFQNTLALASPAAAAASNFCTAATATSAGTSLLGNFRGSSG